MILSTMGNDQPQRQQHHEQDTQGVADGNGCGKEEEVEEEGMRMGQEQEFNPNKSPVEGVRA